MADGKMNKNALAGKRGASATLTPHVCPSCNERVPENQLLVVMQHVSSKRRRTQGFHRACYRLAG
jgi:hypothetical protein